MYTEDFTKEHIEQAALLVKSNYEEEQTYVPDLPKVDFFPELNSFAENNLGAAAIESGKMVGFLCCYSPFDNAFGTTGVKGIFSPIHAHGATAGNRDKIYARLYQAAAKKWVHNGALSNAICLYSHDKAAIDLFFRYGFGLRCVDAIRTLDEIPKTIKENYEYSELNKSEILSLLPFRNKLIEHLSESPTFLKHSLISESDYKAMIVKRSSRIFGAKYKNEIAAYIEITDEGENFACDAKDMKNICGAYCSPKHRGGGFYYSLLSHVMYTLKQEGYKRLGVDFESFNPTAWGFWTKHFTPYTYSLVRRIDGPLLQCH